MITSPILIFIMRRKYITLKSRKTLCRLITTSSVYGTKTSKKMMGNITYSTYDDCLERHKVSKKKLIEHTVKHVKQ